MQLCQISLMFHASLMEYMCSGKPLPNSGYYYSLILIMNHSHAVITCRVLPGLFSIVQPGIILQNFAAGSLKPGCQNDMI